MADNAGSAGASPFFATEKGSMFLGDSLDFMRHHLGAQSVNLIMTSPPFGLVRKKGYGNVDADKYVEWFRPFGEEFRRILKPNGSLVIDIGGSWNVGQPTRSLYHYELLIMLCRRVGFHLAQEFFWWNPAKLPSPAEWVTVRRIRVKDAVNCIWWLSPTPWPKASNRRVQWPYSDSMYNLLKSGYRAKKRPSGHDISDKFSINNGAAISPNLIALANTESNSHYQRYCTERGLTPNPARYPAAVPEYFVRMLTDPGDLVLDPFAGSCVTGEVSERLNRRWLCVELVKEYLEGAVGRFRGQPNGVSKALFGYPRESDYYRVPRPGVLWNGREEEPLQDDGGLKRPQFGVARSVSDGTENNGQVRPVGCSRRTLACGGGEKRGAPAADRA
ncbi:MAG: site-specific DNA-methyltransferase [Chloroflexi bacterium]|nr:site-specific DNA-methyltransferase [Chloroflexota bacterium]